MTVSVVVPLREGEDYAPFRIRGTEEIPVRGGTVAWARNEGARRARGDELLFIDADMVLPRNLDASELGGHGFDMGTAFYRTEPLDAIVGTAQNILAAAGHPFSFFGGFMYMKRAVFQDVGGFREVPLEDIEFAHRAWLKGWRIGVFPLEVVHGRVFKWSHAVGPVVDGGRVWGVP